MAWTIRDAQESDASEIPALNTVVQALHFEQRPDRFKPPDREAVLAVVISWLHAENTRAWVAQAGTELVGYVVAITSDRPGHAFGRPATVVVLDQLVVAPQARRQGVGRALCEEVLRWAAEQRADRVDLTTWNFNREAQTLFSSLGFTTDLIQMSRRPEAD